MDFQTFKAEMKRGLNVYQAFKHADDLVTAMEGMEQNKKEVEAAVKAAKAELANTQAQLETAKAAVDKAQNDAKDKAALAEADYKARMEAAKDAHATKLAQYADEAAKLAADNDAVRAANDALKAEGNALEAKRKAIQDQIDALKKSMGA